MKGRLLFFVGLAIGYVLGARAGRPAYDRIASRAEGAWHDPRVQQRVHDAEQAVKDAAPVVAEKAKDAAAGAAAKVKDAVQKSRASDDADDADTEG